MHKHHVTPRYRDPTSTITVEVTVTQHAMFHFANWQLWGDKRDLLASRALSKQIGEEEIFLERSSIGGKNNSGRPKSAEHRAKIAASNQGFKLTPESRKKHKESMVGNTNSHSQKTPEARARHSEIMKAAWARRKAREL
jgi:hypothetical protein